jgi:hypothetical protein
MLIVGIKLATPVIRKGTLRLKKEKYAALKDKYAALHRARLLSPDADLPLVKHYGRAYALLPCSDVTRHAKREA